MRKLYGPDRCLSQLVKRIHCVRIRLFYVVEIEGEVVGDCRSRTDVAVFNLFNKFIW